MIDPYETLGITPAFAGDLKAVRNGLAKRYFEAGETPDEERMKAINLAYELLRERGPVAVAVTPLAIATAGLPGARAGAPYRAQLTAAGGAAPYTWEAVMPAGLALDGAGAISGRAQRTGSFPLTLTVTDRDGRTAQRVVVLHVEPAPLRLTTEALPEATIGVPYQAEIGVEGGVAPLRWSGELPAGLQFGDGVIFGTPLAPCTTVRVCVRDSARQTVSAALALSVHAVPPPSRDALAGAILLAAVAGVLLSFVIGPLALVLAAVAVLAATVIRARLSGRRRAARQGIGQRRARGSSASAAAGRGRGS